MGTLFASARTFTDYDIHRLGFAATDELKDERLANRFAVELRVDVFKARDTMAGERDENMSDDDARSVRGAFGFDLENDGGGFFGALQGLAESVGQTDGLEADTEIALRDVALFQERIDDAIDCRRGNCDCAEAG